VLDRGRAGVDSAARNLMVIRREATGANSKPVEVDDHCGGRTRYQQA
jgi:hypothetical protein